MDVMEMVAQARDTFTVKRVFGDPYEKDGVTVIPAARVSGGGGGGAGGVEGSAESGAGGGYGVSARPVGAYVIKDGNVTWVPAVDATRLAAAGSAVTIAFLLTWRSIRKAKLRTRRKEARHA